jgi:UDP-N-acetylmuramoylalanine--D-glutamate ligase
VHWFNDSKGTNVGATIAALEGLHPAVGTGRAVLIAGGEGKGADFRELAPVVVRTCRAVVLIGRDAPLLERVLTGHTELVHADDLAQAVQEAACLARPGDHVLLSPACASFDMFRNYEHRGELFTDLVQRQVQ